MSKGKIYQKNGRTFEVKIYNECQNTLISIYIDEILHPERKIFKKKRYFYAHETNLNKYDSIEHAVNFTFFLGFENEKREQIIADKWEEWNK